MVPQSWDLPRQKRFARGAADSGVMLNSSWILLAAQSAQAKPWLISVPNRPFAAAGGSWQLPEHKGLVVYTRWARSRGIGGQASWDGSDPLTAYSDNRQGHVGEDDKLLLVGDVCRGRPHVLRCGHGGRGHDNAGRLGPVVKIRNV